ncbi:Capsular polysaccharide biosynthesis protein [Blastococcus fimeti]|nr:Capsular polysaccharide biosynthesis protein [Blastococcus fimeti]
MELRDYLAALRRYWTTWVGVTLAAVTVALVVVLSASPTYEAKASVFVAASSSESNSGAQFIKQRVTSYPDVADSEAVLGPVIEDMGLTTTVAQLRARVSADNPLESSQIDILVTDPDAEQAAAIANAVADEFRRVVEQLETPSEGEAPVSLTVTDPANTPSSPVSPQPALFLGLGLVVGLALGAALAVIRSRTDTRLHTEDDVRAAWGADGDELAVLSTARRGRRAHRLAGRPASLVARRLATPVGSMPVRAVVLGVDPEDDHQVARTFADEVAGELVEGGVAANVTGPVGGPAKAAKPFEVQLATATPRVPLSEWRAVGERYDGVVLVAESGRVDGADLREIRAILATASARLLAVVLLPRRRTRLGFARRGTDPAPEARAGANLVRTREKIALEKV